VRQEIEDVLHEERQWKEDDQNGKRRPDQPLPQLDQVRQETLFLSRRFRRIGGRGAHR
jgi:hypothetical protein